MVPGSKEIGEPVDQCAGAGAGASSCSGSRGVIEHAIMAIATKSAFQVGSVDAVPGSVSVEITSQIASPTFA